MRSGLLRAVVLHRPGSRAGRTAPSRHSSGASTSASPCRSTRRPCGSWPVTWAARAAFHSRYEAIPRYGPGGVKAESRLCAPCIFRFRVLGAIPGYRGPVRAATGASQEEDPAVSSRAPRVALAPLSSTAFRGAGVLYLWPARVHGGSHVSICPSASPLPAVPVHGAR